MNFLKVPEILNIPPKLFSFITKFNKSNLYTIRKKNVPLPMNLSLTQKEQNGGALYVITLSPYALRTEHSMNANHVASQYISLAME